MEMEIRSDTSDAGQFLLKCCWEKHHIYSLEEFWDESSQLAVHTDTLLITLVEIAELPQKILWKLYFKDFIIII